MVYVPSTREDCGFPLFSCDYPVQIHGPGVPGVRMMTKECKSLCAEIEKVSLVLFGNGVDGLEKRSRRMEKMLIALLILVGIVLLKEAGVLKLLSLI